MPLLLQPTPTHGPPLLNKDLIYRDGTPEPRMPADFSKFSIVGVELSTSTCAREPISRSARTHRSRAQSRRHRLGHSSSRRSSPPLRPYRRIAVPGLDPSYSPVRITDAFELFKCCGDVLRTFAFPNVSSVAHREEAAAGCRAGVKPFAYSSYRLFDSSDITPKNVAAEQTTTDGPRLRRFCRSVLRTS